jgi:hypothetical protein
VFSRTVQDSRIRQALNQVIHQQIDTDDEIQLLDFDFEKNDEGIQVTTRLYANISISTDVVDSWREQMSKAIDQSVDLTLISIPIQQVQSSDP